MVAVIKPQQVKVITKDGECHIHLDITLHIDTAGVQVSAASTASKATEDVAEEDAKWAIPDFSGTGSIDFGKEV